MRTWFLRLLKNDSPIQEKKNFSIAQRVAIAAIVGFAAIGQLWRVSDPYWLAFETGFQELIARRHIDPGLSMTHGLSTLNNLGPEPAFHSTHPPLLQLSLAGLFTLLGESEATARMIPITSFWILLWGIWRLSHSLSPNARICALAAATIIPLSFSVGRIVNFEAPVLMCIVLTMVCAESLNRRFSIGAWMGIGVLGICGTLIDWPYPLFVTCLFAASWFRVDRVKRYSQAIALLWILSMGTSLVYVLAVNGAGVFQTMVNHAQLQTGMVSSEDRFQWPPILVSFQWWVLLIGRLARYGTPVFTGVTIFWLIHCLYNRRFLSSLHHGCFVLFLFCAVYISLFSRASHNHLWCQFYVAPLFSLTFGLVVERVKPQVGYLLLAIAILFATPVIWEFRHKTPLRDSVQAGRMISAATECLPTAKRAPMEGPLLYVNRVDPLPYYARCETAFSHLSVWVSAPEKFLIRCRPEFVVLSGYEARPSITIRPEYSQDLFDRLNKSYSLIHQQKNMEIWESLWSPCLSILGLIETPEDSKPETSLIDDGSEVHTGFRAERSRSPLVFDLRRISQPGRRWLHGWVIAKRPPYLDPIPVSVCTGAGDVLGAIQAIPQDNPVRWQEFWLPVGDLPEKLILSWPQGSIVWGDLRLMNESLWATDLCRLLAAEIHRQAGASPYEETMELVEENKKIPVVLQHPGFGVDSVDLPPMRIGLDQDLLVQYGLSPSAYSQSDGVTFRLSAFDHALGRKDILFEESIDPQKDSADRAWHTRRISMKDHSRHVLVFTFEVDPGPKGDANSDQAIWREVKFVNAESL